MVSIARRAWLTAMGLAPVAGGLAAWAELRSAKAAPRKLSPRERIQKYNLPNVELVTHEGKKVRFYDDLVKDKKVLINFMYAECAGICVPVTANLVKVKRMLGDRVGREIFFYSITLKPEEDSPEALRHYAEMHNAGPGWLFLTGERAQVETLRRALGYFKKDPIEDADKSTHIGMLRFGIEAEMRWAACPGMAQPDHILRTLLWEFEHPVPATAG